MIGDYLTVRAESYPMHGILSKTRLIIFNVCLVEIESNIPLFPTVDLIPTFSEALSKNLYVGND